MKKIKYLILLIPFVLCGCDAEYNLEIIDDTYSESLTVSASESADTELVAYGMSLEEYKEYYVEKPIPVSIESGIRSEDNETDPLVSYYTKEDLSNDDELKMNFSYVFTKSAFQNSRIVNESYNRFLMGTIDGNITLSTGEVLRYFKEVPILSTVTIKITTNHTVIDNNADEIDDDTYIWYVTEENAEDKSIEFTFSESEVEEKGTFDSASAKIVIGAIIVILALGLLTLIFVLIKKRRNNKI